MGRVNLAESAVFADQKAIIDNVGINKIAICRVLTLRENTLKSDN
jgi:hypothetical protein